VVKLKTFVEHKLATDSITTNSID